MTVTPYDVVALDPRRFHYQCSQEHLIVNAQCEQKRCPVYVRGEACVGLLHRFGPGSRQIKAAPEAVTPAP